MSMSEIQNSQQSTCSLNARFVFLLCVMACLLYPARCLAGDIHLPWTGQQNCYGMNFSVIPCINTGQDAEMKAGVQWPEPRFRDNRDGTITDYLTGLMWTKNADILNAPEVWHEALQHISNMNKEKGTFGYTDWRLPNINELRSLVNNGQENNSLWLVNQGFRDVRELFYWSSTTYAKDTAYAWVLFMGGGIIGAMNKYGDAFAIAVRDVEEKGSVTLPATGQDASYFREDDGDIKKGEAWPSGRFIVKKKCVLDKLTGLLWTRDANLSGNPLTWHAALDHVKELHACGYEDWRLPNIHELRSIFHFGMPDVPEWLMSQGFKNVQKGYYWSSTTSASNPPSAKVVHMSHYGMRFGAKNVKSYFWPVRGGEGSGKKEPERRQIPFTQ